MDVPQKSLCDGLLCMSQPEISFRTSRMSTDSTVCHTLLAAATIQPSASHCTSRIGEGVLPVTLL